MEVFSMHRNRVIFLFWVVFVLSMIGAVSVITLLISTYGAQWWILSIAVLFALEIVGACLAYVWYEAELVRLHRQLAKTEDERNSAKKEARVDPLTGLLNRRGMFLMIHTVFSARTRMRLSHDDTGANSNQRITVVTVAAIDLDGFKAVNDTVGHPMGDTVIRLTSRLLHQYFARREIDIVCRLGGDEFLVFIVGDNNISQTISRLEEFRQALATGATGILPASLCVTASCGVRMGLISEENRNLDSMIDHIIDEADTLLYDAKRAGRNQVFSSVDDRLAGQSSVI